MCLVVKGWDWETCGGLEKKKSLIIVEDVVLKSRTFHSSSNSRVWKVKMKCLSTSKKLTDALQQKHSELPKHWNLLPSPPQQPTRRLIAERRQRQREEKSRACASLSGSFPPQVLCRRQLSISRCNLQSESCCNYTPESSYTPERRRKWKNASLSAAGWAAVLGLRCGSGR